MEDFKPYEQEKMYTVVLTHDEALLIQDIRKIHYGSKIVHIVNSKIVRTETKDSDLNAKRKGDTITIAIDMV